MANFLKNILDCVGGDESKILAFTFNGAFDWGYFDDNKSETLDKKRVPKDLVNKLLTWQEAKPYTNYDYDDGYGGMDCHNVIFWTAEEVFYIHEYDGSTRFQSVPRNPENFKPSSN